MQCREFQEYTERWMEGEHGPEAALHLEACPRCRGLVADLDAICHAARGFEAEVEPPPRLWTSIRAQLEAEGMIRPRSWAEALAGFFPRELRPALATAYVAVLVVAAALVSYQGSRPLHFATPSLPTPEIASTVRAPLISENTLATLHTHNPEVSRSYRESLKMVDSVILECEMMVRREPQNELAREFLTGAYQQKADLLAAITERGTLGE